MIFKRIVCLFFLLFLTVQSSASEQEKRLEEKAREEVDQAPSHQLKSPFIHTDYGGWVNFRYNRFYNEDNDESASDSLRTYNYWDTRLWFKLTLMPEILNGHEHAVYVRLKDRYITRSGNAPGERYDISGPHLDYAYTILDFRPVWVEAGRRYFNIGKGIVYSDINDGVQINFKKPGFNAGLFASQTLPHQSNIDASVPGYDKDSDRHFYGLGLGYTGIPRQSLYGFVLSQRDLSDEDPNNSSQNYTYNSEYFGIGMKGKIGRLWSYWTEFIEENGSSRIFGTDERKNVRAYAADTEIVFSPPIKTYPRFSLEYAFGSGDSDRISVTDTQSGNRAGGDNNFLYFGYAPTGYALAPRLSNLHMLKAGMTSYPFGESRLFKNLNISLEYYQFFKNRKSGGISDLEATEIARDIGKEVDLSMRWRVLSDLTLSVEYGHFMPGRSYADSADNPQDFFSLGLIHTF